MKDIHPPMTGLEAHFEKELGYDRKPNGKFSDRGKKMRSKPARENAQSRRVEEAMILGR